jgi:signal transduction histidine kinase
VESVEPQRPQQDRDSRDPDTWDKAAYDELPDGVVVVDETGSVVVINAAAVRLLGRSVDESIGRDYREVLALTDPTGVDWWACTQPFTGLSTRTGQPERRLVLTTPRLELRELLVTARYVRDEGRVVRLVVCLRDTASRERHERSRADLVSTVAHELRSPLTSVKGFTATLLAKWDRFNDEQKKVMLATVNADADRVTRLISELLDVSRIDAGRLELRKQVVDVARAARRLVEGRVASGDAEGRFVVSAEEGLPEVWGDPDKVDQVLGNLLENAVRHGRGTVSIDVSSFADGLQVVIEDQGDGVPVEMWPRIFTRFWRGDRRGSTGLGLYIVKGLVEAHGGVIEVGRAQTGGARFRFTLPEGRPYAD